jgi:hypothetical protein
VTEASPRTVPAFLNPSGPAADERMRYFETQSSTKKGTTSMDKTNLGVALVTGASTGIGRLSPPATSQTVSLYLRIVRSLPLAKVMFQSKSRTLRR